ncbi:MAG TPA: DNA-binding protein [Planctomycetales bacterium]|jgi:HEPN domain-containing protein|nr:DNA-binding protein [Planctomycetales bacterium]
MPAPNPLLAVIREWIDKAENDLTNAAHTLTLGIECPTDTVCFHAQQCVEKYIKALLISRAATFPRTHDIRLLRALLPPKLRPKLEKEVQSRFTKYAVTLRYPVSEPAISLTEARKAVAIARQVRKEIRRSLPPAALRRKHK